MESILRESLYYISFNINYIGYALYINHILRSAEPVSYIHLIFI